MAVSLLEIFVGITLLVYISSAQESPSNVAVNKKATQSSTFDGTDRWAIPPLTYTASANLAVDGAPTKSYLDKTCAVTKWLASPFCTDNPWWQVDLGGQYDVFNVTIYQRGAGETDKENWGPLVVRIGERVERPENRTKYADRPVVSIPLSPPVTASTVNISITGRCSILTLCEVEVFAVRHVNECNSSPCHHGGSCTDGLFNYTCTCVPGYTGANCETDVDECMLGYCQHGATCSNTAGSYSCGCAVGYTGRNCASDLDECALRYCQSGSTCMNTQGSYSCSCGVGYTGRNCSEDVDECALKFCRNGGNCMNSAGSYSCSCVPGFSGRNCSTDVDECALRYCQIGATCMNIPGSYSCSCGVGYTGRNCTEDVDECELKYCQNGATCVNTRGSYNCRCAAGFNDFNCSTDVDECASSPCSNHSFCIDGINRYTCECRAGYGGDTCTKPCSGGTFGPGCKKTCSSNCLDVDGGGGQHCDGTTGRCLLEGCKGNHEGPMCMTEEQPAPDRYTEGWQTGLGIGLGAGLGVGLGTSLLLAVFVFVLLRRRRHRSPSSDGTSMGDVQMSSRQMEAAARQQRHVSQSPESTDYEILDDATKDCNLPSPYSELGEIKETQSVYTPYSN